MNESTIPTPKPVVREETGVTKLKDRIKTLMELARPSREQASTTDGDVDASNDSFEQVLPQFPEITNELTLLKSIFPGRQPTAFFPYRSKNNV